MGTIGISGVRFCMEGDPQYRNGFSFGAFQSRRNLLVALSHRKLQLLNTKQQGLYLGTSSMPGPPKTEVSALLTNKTSFTLESHLDSYLIFRKQGRQENTGQKH